MAYYPSKHETWNQCWVNVYDVGPTLIQCLVFAGIGLQPWQQGILAQLDGHSVEPLQARVQRGRAQGRPPVFAPNSLKSPLNCPKYAQKLAPEPPAQNWTVPLQCQPNTNSIKPTLTRHWRIINMSMMNEFCCRPLW